MRSEFRLKFDQKYRISSNDKAQGLQCDLRKGSKLLALTLNNLSAQFPLKSSSGHNTFETALSLMVVKTMQRAEYFCTGAVEDKSSYR